MPAPATADELFDLIRKSGVLDESRVSKLLNDTSLSARFRADPSGLARHLIHEGTLTYFQADQLLQGKWKRFTIGKYRVLERLGTGGMGQVFLCEHKLMKRRVAVKVLPAAKAANPASLERFYREARAVAALDHPNIVRAYDIDQDENLHFLVMEFVDGTNLHDLVKKIGPLDVTRACHYIYASTIGLLHANEMGLVHRDIKPANILVDRFGIVKILDMGLAKFFNDDNDVLTKKYDESVLGTADYLSPEQAIDLPSIDIRADLYGLGGTFYFLLSGHPPFPTGTISQKLLWHQTQAPVSIRSLRPDIPAEISEIIDKLLAKNPDDRYQTPAELAALLEPWVQSPIAPPSESELPVLSRAAGAGGANQSRHLGSTTATSSSLFPAFNPAMVNQPVSSRETLSGDSPIKQSASETRSEPSRPRSPWMEIGAETQRHGVTNAANRRNTSPQAKPTSAIKSNPFIHRPVFWLIVLVVTLTLAATLAVILQ